MILNSIEDREKWLSLISFLPAEYQDIYYHPDYISLNCLNKNSQVFYFLTRKIRNYGLIHLLELKYQIYLVTIRKIFDIETAYGYGGPISNTKDLLFINNSNSRFF